jgi:trimeric autotransporter adhesin
VAPGASCDINISFTPTVTGQAAGLVKIIDSASSRPQFIEAFGEGTAIELSPAALNFHSQKVGTTSAPLPVKMTNQGSAAVSFYDIHIEGNNSTSFSQQNHCAKGLAPGASCTLLVSFTPNRVGPRHAKILVGVAGGGSPRFLPLVGSGN